MKVLITSIVDLRRVTHNRIHVFVDYLSRTHEVTALCLNAWWLAEGDGRSCGTDYYSDPYFQEMFDRTRILYLSQGRAPPVVQELTCLGALNSLLHEIDYAGFDVHVNYCNLIAGYFVARKLNRLGIPTVFDIADDLPRRVANSPQVGPLLKGPASLVARFMFAENVKLAGRVTFVTRALKDSYHLPSDKASFIPNGVNPMFLTRHASPMVRQTLGIEGSFVLGFVGVLLARVDLDLMFATMRSVSKKLPNVKMLIVGGGDRLREAQELAQRYGLSNRVIFTGFVPFHQVPQYIACMDTCLVPIARSADCQHAFPVKLAEYMACEKAVISTPLAGVREAVGDRVLYAQDTGQLEDKIRLLYYDGRLRHEMGVRGREFVQQNYSWPEICYKFEQVLSEVASRPAIQAAAYNGE